MADDREIARKAMDFQARAKDHSMFEIPGYREWSERKLAAGESPAFIAHLDATKIWCLPEELSQYGEKVFEEMLADVRASCDTDDES